MNLLNDLYKDFVSYLEKNYSIDSNTNFTFDLNTSADNKFGDISSNIAMILSKGLKKAPREVATEISQDFKNSHVQKIEIAGPGFLNFFLTDDFFTKLLNQLDRFKETFFKNESKKHSYNIEFLSANPTGPIHLGNGRGGIIGDVLGNVLKFLENKVTKEYYVNDAGAQILKLGNAFKVRCGQALGLESELPEDSYHGEYLIDLAQEYINQAGPDALKQSDEFFADYAKNKILEQIKNTLIDYGIIYDKWFSEKSLHASGQVLESIKDLTKNGFTYEKEGAVWFKSTDFGDDKDRVLIKADGETTYVAADIAYMKNKVERGADYMIMTLGHDHHGFVQRLHGLQKAIKLDQYPLEVILYQLVKMKMGSKQLRMSKRAGSGVTLQDVIETVGKDVARFFYLNKKADSPLEFDLELALKETDENPVFYIQYAYVRAKSILEKAAQEGLNVDYEYAKYINDDEKALLKHIANLQSILATIERSHQTHLLANYVIELATNFHSYYNRNRIVGIENKNLALARLLIVDQIKNSLKVCFDLLGISAPDKM